MEEVRCADGGGGCSGGSFPPAVPRGAYVMWHIEPQESFIRVRFQAGIGIRDRLRLHHDDACDEEADIRARHKVVGS